MTLRIGPQKGPQADLISCPVNEIMFGGARGGGKTRGLILDWLAHQERNGSAARGIIFRRTYKELENIIEQSKEVYLPFGATYKASDYAWTFPNRSTLKLRHLDREADADDYQGHEYSWIGWDEAGNWPTPKPIDKLRACLRSTAGIRPRMVLTSNPGGPGHNWLKRRFVDPLAPRKVQYIEGESGETWTRVFIPSRVEDNRILMRTQPGYVDQIRQSGPPWLVKAWLAGDWNIVAGGALDDLWRESKHVVAPFAIPEAWRVDRSFDWGSSAPFSVLWWAEANGEAYKDADHQEVWVPKGTLFLIAEWYGANDRGEGLKHTNATIANGVLQREQSMPITQRIRPGPADTMIYSVVNGTSIADEMATAGVAWEPAMKGAGSRVNGLQLFRDRLAASLEDHMEQPGLFVFDTCRHFIANIPVLQRDDRNVEDVDTDQEDHDYDAARYRIMARVEPGISWQAVEMQ